jgi:hypothetical protein
MFIFNMKIFYRWMWYFQRVFINEKNIQATLDEFQLCGTNNNWWSYPLYAINFDGWYDLCEWNEFWKLHQC